MLSIKQIQNEAYNLNNIGNKAKKNILEEYNVIIMSKKYKELYI